MPDPIITDYFCGDESQQLTHFCIRDLKNPALPGALDAVKTRHDAEKAAVAAAGDPPAPDTDF